MLCLGFIRAGMGSAESHREVSVKRYIGGVVAAVPRLFQNTVNGGMRRMISQEDSYEVM